MQYSVNKCITWRHQTYPVHAHISNYMYITIFYTAFAVLYYSIMKDKLTHIYLGLLSMNIKP